HHRTGRDLAEGERHGELPLADPAGLADRDPLEEGRPRPASEREQTDQAEPPEHLPQVHGRPPFRDPRAGSAPGAESSGTPISPAATTTAAAGMPRPAADPNAPRAIPSAMGPPTVARPNRQALAISKPTTAAV